MDRDDVSTWVERYVEAWHTNDGAKIGALFANDAVYFSEPFAEPWSGRDEIVREWLERKDEPGTWRFEFEVLAVDGRLGFIRGHTTYVEPPREYWNMWEVKLDESGQQCERYVEWWMKKTDS